MTSASADSTPPGQLYCANCEKTYAAGERCPVDGSKLVRLSGQVDPFVGRVLDGRYSVLAKLGQGGMGAVYRGSDGVLQRDVAIKVIGATHTSDPDVIKRFFREAKLASKLAHPNAVAVLDFGQTDDHVSYLIMELVTGRTLAEVIDAEGRFPPERVVRIGMQICDALEGAHGLSIVHRDLKPSNIMVLARGRDLIKVLDFGLAKSFAPDQAATTMTNAGAMLGTPAFMPPELATGQPCDARADLYSLGCVLFLLGTGRLPFVSESMHELIAMHGTEPAPPMSGVPVGLARVVERLLEKDPGDRFQSAADARDALDDCLDPARATIYDSHVAPVPSVVQPPPVGAAPTPYPGELSTLLAPGKRSRWPWLVVALVLCGGGAAGVVVMMNRGETAPAVEAPPLDPGPAEVDKPKDEPRPADKKTDVVEPPKDEPKPVVDKKDDAADRKPAEVDKKPPKKERKRAPEIRAPKQEPKQHDEDPGLRTVKPEPPPTPPPPTPAAGSGSAQLPF